MADQVNVRKVFESLARIIGRRYNVKITVIEVKKKEETQEKTA